MSLNNMLCLRKKHETRLAVKAVRTSRDKHRSPPEDSYDTKARNAIIKRINEVLKQQQDVGAGSGAERNVRWKGHALTGNTANAAAAAETRAAKVSDFEYFLLKYTILYLLSRY